MTGASETYSKVPIPPGFRGWDYARYVRKLKDEAEWTCSICGWQAKKSDERVNIIAHHPDKGDLFNVIIICEACHYNIHWGKSKKVTND